YESIESEAGPPPGAGGGSPFEGPAVPEGAGFDAEFDPSTDLAEPTPPEMSDEAFKQYVREQIGDPTWEPPPPSASPFADDLP
ncbi:MAG TPA: hypothetical protein VM618_05340, partial [Acidimicrobiia bacterium]|nr:hypothetical protein [Acidimicrobiia bacterium]